MQNLRKQIAILWLVVLATVSILAAMIVTCDCPTQIVSGKLGVFMADMTTDLPTGVCLD